MAPTGLHWLAVAGLGVAFAISGSFSGWNAGLGLGGWGGMMLASVSMAIFYLCLTQCVAELASACPEGADGMDTFAAIGLGQAGRFFAGISIAVAVGFVAGACASFIVAYCEPVLGIGGTSTKLVLMLLLIAFQLRGAREVVSLTMVGGFLSFAVLALFCVAMAPGFSVAGLYWHEGGGATLLPHGLAGAWQAIPYALFMFLGVEQAANAAGDMHEPVRNLPKAIFFAVATVLAIGMSVLVFSTAGGIAAVAAADGNPLYVAMSHLAGQSNAWLEWGIGIGSIVSLLSTVFSLIYAASRQFYSLARAGLLPAALARTNRRGAPSQALWLVGALALLGAFARAETVLVCFVFGLNICNALVLLSFLRARRKQPGLPRSYRAIGGRGTAVAALLLVLAVLGACLQLEPQALLYVAAGYAVLGAYYFFHRRHRRASFLEDSQA